MPNGQPSGGNDPDSILTWSRERRPLWTRWRETLLLIAVAFVVYGMLLQPGHAPHSVISDLVSYGWPTKQVLYDSLQAGEGLPLWRSDQLSGSIATTQPQALYTYPLELLYWIVPPLSAAGPSLWLHLLVAGLGCLVWGRQLGLGRSGRVVMGIAGLLSFKLMLAVHVGWTPVLPALSLLPWMAAALGSFVARPTSTRGILLATAVAMTLLAGTLQYPYYLALLCTPWLVWTFIRLLRDGNIRQAQRMLLGGLAAGGLGFMIAAHLWLPVLSDLPLLARGSLNYSFFLGTSPLDSSSLVTLISPEALGTPRLGIFKFRLWEDGLYFGWLPLGLALLAVLTGWRKPAVRWIAVAALTSMLLAFDTPLLRGMFDWFPGYALFRIPARILFITSYAVIALAGFGADWLDARLRARSARIAFLVIIALVAFMTVEGAVRARQYFGMRPHEDFERPLPVLEALATDAKPYRVAQVGGKPPNFASTIAGLEFVDGYDPYALDHYRDYLEAVGKVQRPSPYSQIYLMSIQRWDMLSALNVRYLFSTRAIRHPSSWTLAGRWQRHPAYAFARGNGSQPLWLYERTDPIERAFLVERIIPVTDARQASRAIRRIDFNRVAVVEAKAETHLENQLSPGDVLDVVEAKPGRLKLRSRTAEACFAVVSEVWHPGWRAFVDGTPVPLHRTNVALLGLTIPPGDHDISLRFTPSHWVLGWSLGAAGVALIIALTIRGLYLRNGAAMLAESD
jgi:hypothetical protein